MQSSGEARKCPGMSMRTSRKVRKKKKKKKGEKKQWQLGQSLFFALGGRKLSLYSFQLRPGEKGAVAQ